MNRYKLKQLQIMKQIQQLKANQFKNALIRIIQQDQSIRIWLDYAEEAFNQPIKSYEDFQEYSPNQLSKIILEKELQQIKKQMQKMPEKQCKIQHFIVIILKVMRFPFEKIPYYMIGLKDMFYQIIDDNKDTINYEDLFKYILGQVIIMKQQQQNTQFHVHFIESKKQDYLLHDNGIKKLHYSSDLKVFMSLDEQSNNIKFYNEEMKQIHKYNAKKELHDSKIPFILDFDYSQLTMRLGIIFNDNTIESIHLPHYLQKSQEQFESLSLNQLLYTTPEKMSKIVYLQMINKWLTVSQQTNRLYLYDMQKVILKPQQVQQKLNINTHQLKITFVKQIVSLSLVCIVSGNQIYFFNENFTEQMFPKFSHHQDIRIFKYSQQYSTFYLAGQEKFITYFMVNRNRINFKLYIISFNKIIIDFQIFPIYDSILIVDKDQDARLFHISSKAVYQIQPSSRIVKTKDSKIKITKLSKNQFLLYESYMIIYHLQKVAIIKDAQFEFLPYYYFDAKKEELFLSVNGQILSFSTTFGEIRKSFNEEISNINKHQWFFVSKKTNIFIIDNKKAIYELYIKSDTTERQYKNHKKKMAIQDINSYLYDEQMRTIMIVNNESITQLRNDYNNNFNSINNIEFDGISNIQSCKFCPVTKYLTFLTNKQIIYQFKNFQKHFSKAFKFIFSKAAHDAVQKVIIQHEYCCIYEIIILLNNRNQLALVERLNPKNYVLINLQDHLPYKLKHLIFNKFNYQVIKRNNKNYTSVILYGQNGYLFDIDLKHIIFSKFINNQKENVKVYKFAEESYVIQTDNLTIQQQTFATQEKLTLTSQEYKFKNLHDKPIVLATKLNLQIISTLTISSIGMIKLWNNKFEHLFCLKMPSLTKIKWNMNEILNIKTQRSVTQLKKIIYQHYSKKKQIIQVGQAINKNKKYKVYDEPKKIKFSQQIPFQIQSKELEQIIIRQLQHSKEYQTIKKRNKFKNNPQNTLQMTIDTHPWRHRRQFTKIFEKASPPHKYSTIIPKDLITLRASLDMRDRKKIKTPSYNEAQTILPLLKTYEYEPKVDLQMQKKDNNPKELSQNFEACFYIKNSNQKRKLNELDQIDRQFLRKQFRLKKKKVTSHQHKSQKKKSNIESDDYVYSSVQLDSINTVKDIERVFLQHNRECYMSGRGHFIKVPKINLPKDD